MSLEFPSTLEKPSNITPLPGNFVRPAFEKLYGFDIEDGTLRAYYDTQAAIEARSPVTVGDLYYAYDSDRLYVADGTDWQYYTST
jgi:hypothetical protein